MRSLLALSMVFWLLTVVSCTHTTRELHQGFGLQVEARIPRSDEGRFAKSGHLLERASASVLSVTTFHPGVLWVMDDEHCGLLLVELPDESIARADRVFNDPRAYIRRWSCTWGHPKEEQAIGGSVRIKRVTKDGVRAAITLQFASGMIKASGLFKKSPPDNSIKADTFKQESTESVPVG